MSTSRRDFIRNGLIAVSVGVAAPHVLLRTAHATPAAAARLRERAPRTLVVIECGGGNDGLNTVIPYADETYYRLRPTLAIKREDAVVLTDELAFHPALGPLADLWQTKQLAIVQGVGYPNPNFSHFRAMEIIKSAVPERYEAVGWLGRHLDLAGAGASDDPFLGVNIAGQLDQTMRSREQQTPVIASAQQYAFQTDPRFGGDRANRLNAFTLLNKGEANGKTMVPLIQDTAQAAYVSARELATLVSAYRSPVEYPGAAAPAAPGMMGRGMGGGMGMGMGQQQANPLANALKLMAQVITADVGMQVGYVTIGGFDTHANQANQQRALLGQLASAVRAFQADLEAQNVADKVLILVTSEFGRRPAENGSLGTDHGSAENWLLLGASVKGAVYGARPSLTDLDNNNLKFTTDFRSIYATLLNDWLRGDARAVLGGDWPTLGFIA